jgi:hypothetical protein
MDWEVDFKPVALKFSEIRTCLCKTDVSRVVIIKTVFANANWRHNEALWTLVTRGACTLLAKCTQNGIIKVSQSD